jgi:hypothetical protein
MSAGPPLSWGEPNASPKRWTSLVRSGLLHVSRQGVGAHAGRIWRRFAMSPCERHRRRAMQNAAGAASASACQSVEESDVDTDSASREINNRGADPLTEGSDRIRPTDPRSAIKPTTPESWAPSSSTTDPLGARLSLIDCPDRLRRLSNRFHARRVACPTCASRWSVPWCEWQWDSW